MMHYAAIPIAAAVLFLTSASFAAETVITGSVLFEAGAKRLTVDETKTIIQPGTKVESFRAKTEAVRYWTNEPSGKFIASRQGGSKNAMSTGSGEWKLTESGKYCVVIEWRSKKGTRDNTEDWCYVLYRYDNELYLAHDDLASHLDKKYSVVRFTQP